MLNFLRIASAITIVFALGGHISAAEVPDVEIARVAEAWATIEYHQAGDPHRLTNALALEDTAAALSERFPQAAEALFWQANALLLTADIMHSLGSLEKVRRARTLLEQAEALAPASGAIKALLGSLYYEVPGWPIGFGNRNKAAAYLQRALEVDPEGVDANYFMGDFLLQSGKPTEAAAHLEKALAASQGMAPSVAVDGRRQEIQHVLDEARKRTLH
ncbi:MAG: tetratricopeptide repeat protein [Rhodospirillaceae bacterium]|nr:MAG: tetratricopeptide repeat protein [Rhodospirillaceae bacterium]